MKASLHKGPSLQDWVSLEVTWHPSVSVSFPQLPRAVFSWLQVDILGNSYQVQLFSEASRQFLNQTVSSQIPLEFANLHIQQLQTCFSSIHVHWVSLPRFWQQGVGLLEKRPGLPHAGHSSFWPVWAGSIAAQHGTAEPTRGLCGNLLEERQHSREGRGESVGSSPLRQEEVLQGLEQRFLCRAHTGAGLSWGTAAHGEDPHWSRSEVWRGQSRGENCYRLIANPHCPRLNHLEVGQDEGTKLNLGKRVWGDVLVFVSRHPTLSTLIDNFYFYKLRLFWQWWLLVSDIPAFILAHKLFHLTFFP